MTCLALLLHCLLTPPSKSIVTAPNAVQDMFAIGLTDIGIALFSDTDSNIYQWDTRSGAVSKRSDLIGGILLRDGRLLHMRGRTRNDEPTDAFLQLADGTKQQVPVGFSPFDASQDKLFGAYTGEDDSVYTPAFLENGKLSILPLPAATDDRRRVTGGIAKGAWQSRVYGQIQVGDAVRPVLWQDGAVHWLPLPRGVSGLVVGRVAGDTMYGSGTIGGFSRVVAWKDGRASVLSVPGSVTNAFLTSALPNGVAVGFVEAKSKSSSRSRACMWLSGRFIDLSHALKVEGPILNYAADINAAADVLGSIDGPGRNSVTVLVHCKSLVANRR